MKKSSESGSLKTLGLWDSFTASIERMEVAEWSEEPGWEELPGDVKPLVAKTSTVMLECDVAAEMSFRLATFDGLSNVLRVIAPGKGFRVATPLNEEALVLSEAAFGEFTIALAGDATPVAVVNGLGEGIFLSRSGTTLSVAQLVRLPKSVSAQHELSSDIEEWVASSDDRWLKESVAEKLEIGGNWSHLVAVGLFYRLQNPEDRYTISDPIGALLSGELLAEDERVLGWARDVSEETVEQLSFTALAVIERLRGGLRDLISQEEVPRYELISTLRLRDNIESADVLMHGKPAFERVRLPLELADTMGESLMSKLSGDLDIESDEQLWRAARCTPEAWWAGNDERRVAQVDAPVKRAPVISLTFPEDVYPVPLELADKMGESLMSKLSGDLDIEADEQLWRAARCTPEAWRAGNDERRVAQVDAPVKRAPVISLTFPEDVYLAAAASSDADRRFWLLDDSSELVEEDGQLRIELGLEGAPLTSLALVAISRSSGKELARYELEREAYETHSETTYVELGARTGPESRIQKLIEESGLPWAELAITLEGIVE